MNYSAVIAAAGLSSRMHEFKPMLRLGNTTIIGHVIDSLREAGVGEIVVVTGYKSALLRRHLEPMGVSVCENRDFASTDMLHSLRLGLQALTRPCDFVFLTPGDVPLVQPETLKKMLAHGGSAVCPVCGGKPGHPILLAADKIPALLCYDGQDGLRGFLAALNPAAATLSVDDVGITMDADTPRDFRNLQRRHMEVKSGGRLWPDVRIHISMADAILTPETAQLLEMIDSTGSIRSACACLHMSYSKGWGLLNAMERALGCRLADRFPGGASGGASCLTPRGKRLLAAYQTYHEAVDSAAKALFDRIFTADLLT